MLTNMLIILSQNPSNRKVLLCFFTDFLVFFHPFFDLSFSFLPLYEQMILRYNKVDTVAAEQTRDAALISFIS